MGYLKQCYRVGALGGSFILYLVAVFILAPPLPPLSLRTLPRRCLLQLPRSAANSAITLCCSYHYLGTDRRVLLLHHVRSFDDVLQDRRHQIRLCRWRRRYTAILVRIRGSSSSTTFVIPTTSSKTVATISVCVVAATTPLSLCRLGGPSGGAKRFVSSSYSGREGNSLIVVVLLR